MTLDAKQPFYNIICDSSRCILGWVVPKQIIKYQVGDPFLLWDIPLQIKLVKYISPKYCRYLVNFAVF